MDKYEYKVRADEIKELIAQGEYIQAADIADTIDWRRVKSVMMLCTISDLYKINRRYEDARDMLLLAYERRPGGRTICYSLCELSIKMEEYVQAVEYYKEFVQIAPKDPGRYILQYKLYEAQEVSLEERIEVLEELKKKDYREKWAYELAYLYHRVGLGTRCVEECDELILWFGEGKYVLKAMELKMLHQPLSPKQQEQYDHRFDHIVQTKTSEEQQGSPDIPQQEVPYAAEEQGYTQNYDNDVTINDDVQQGSTADTAEQDDDMDIQVKTMDVGQYNTINLQAELAAGLREVLGEEAHKAEIADPITRSIVEPMLTSDTETLDYPQIEEVDEDDLEPEREEMESSEVFFGETGEIGSLNAEKAVVTEEILPEEASPEENVPDSVPDITGEIVMEQLRQELAPAEQEVLQAEPPKELANVLSQESDGQISLVVPEGENLEKQITGQMSIEDILTEWERMKQENEEKRKEEVRQHVLQQTGSMFTEFEAAVRDGLLEQLENGKAAADEKVADAESSDLEEVDAEPDTEAEEVSAELDTEAEEVDVESTDIESAAQEEADAEDAYTEDTDIEDTDIEDADVEEADTELTDMEAADIEAADAEMIEAELSEEVAEDNFPADDEVEELEEIIENGGEPEGEEAEIIDKAPVERDKAKLRSLTREEKELYAPFIQSRSAKEQLVKALDNISMAAYAGNIIITGEEGMDTLTLAKNMIREIQMTDSNFSGKVAKISGQSLNQRDVTDTVQKLKNGALIIQKASGMSNETAQNLYKSIQKESMGIIVVLEDTKKEMDKLLAANEQLKNSFTARMDVEALSNDTLVAFGRQYAREMEYSIDELGVLALHTRIAELQTIDHVVTVVEVKEIVDEAIHHANRKTLGHFFDVLFAKRYDDEDMIILSEKDFV